MNPILHRHDEDVPLSVTPGAKKIFQAIYKAKGAARAKPDDTIQKIQVSDLISKMAFYYEKIRNAVNYNEDHLQRKDAIARIIKRQIIIESPIKFNRSDTQAAAKHLLMELIRAGYLANNTLPETKIDEVAVVLGKYLLLRRLVTAQAAGNFNFFGNPKATKEFDSKGEVTNWLIGLCAAEIEELVSPDPVSKTVMGVMYKLLEKRLELPASLPYDQDLPLQLYLSIHRCFLKADEDMLSLIVLNYFNGDWENADEAAIKRVASELFALHKLIIDHLRHPIGAQLDRIVSVHTVYFTILRDVVSEDPVAVYDELFDDPKAFPRRLKQACLRRYSTAKSKLWRAAVRSIIYILLTKSVFAVILEVPAAQFFNSDVNPFSLLINIAFPAILLFIAVAVTPLPGEENTKKVVAGIEEIVYAEKERSEPILVRKPVNRSAFMNIIFGIFYTITFFISFGVIVWFLDRLQFSWVSTVIFLFFLAFVSFFTIRIRRGAKQWMVVYPKDNIFRFLLDFFSVPIVATGKWLSGKFSQINVFVFVLDFIIEAPFKIFVDIAEEWTKYVRERKERF